MADAKSRLRKIFRQSRAALGQDAVRSLSGKIQRRVLEWDAYQRAGAVILYASKDNEVLTEEILGDSLQSKRMVLYPRLTPDHSRLELVRISDAAALRPGAFGLLEPCGEETVKLKDLRDVLIFAPGLAFSMGGDRLGRGGGHYDRLLAEADSAFLAGLSYSFQLLDELPTASHDRRLDFVITESAIHPTGAHAPAFAGERVETRR